MLTPQTEQSTSVNSDSLIKTP